MARKPKHEPEVEHVKKRGRPAKAEAPKIEAAATAEPKKRGRPPKASEGAPALRLAVVAGVALNSTLSDSEESALYFQHLKSFEASQAAIAKATADHRNVIKRAKVDLGEHAASLLKVGLAIRTDGGSEKLQDRMERDARVARWMGLPLGAQGALFEPDRRTTEEIADLEGFQAGTAGETMKIPERYGASSDAGQAWAKGWHRGQGVIFNIGEKKGETILRPNNKKAVEELEAADPLADAPADPLLGGDVAFDDYGNPIIAEPEAV